MNEEQFQGPLFIVGMPRSGTKLLRDLLNQNPRIGIPTVESHFIPGIVRKFGFYPNFDDLYEIEDIFEEFRNTTFYWNLRHENRDIFSSDIDFIAKTSWRSVLEAIFRYYASKGKHENFIWGDKTPEYLNHMDLLKSVFPEARFLHIIRDPRDYSLSVNRTWGKSILLASDKWRRSIEFARASVSKMEADYKEVFYENLLQNPAVVLQDICVFLECEFVSDMLELKKAPEEFGDARGRTEIMRDNLNKYRKMMSPAKIRRIEEVVYPVIQSTPYGLLYGKKYAPLKKPTRVVHYLHDGWASVRFHAREKGVLQGIKYFLKLHKESNF